LARASSDPVPPLPRPDELTYSEEEEEEEERIEKKYI